MGNSGDDTIGSNGGTAAGPNLLSNGSFEDGTHSANGVNGLDGWSNWTGSPDAADDGTSSESWNPSNAASDGTGYITMWSGNSGPSEGFQQTLAAPLQAGETYTVTFQGISSEYVSGQWFTPSDIPVEFQIVDITTGTVLGSVTVQGTTYEEYSFDITPTTNVSNLGFRPLTTGAGNNPSIIMDELYLGTAATGGEGCAETGNDTIDGASGDDLIYGASGDDSIQGGEGDDVMFGGFDNDTFYVDTQDNDSIYGGEDADNGDVDVLDLSGISGDFDIIYAGGDNEDGTVVMEDSNGNPTGEVLIFEDIEVIDGVICFARGTQIMTEVGNQSVENLAVGDLVNTMDNGLQPIRWIGKRTVPATGALAPVVFKAGALGNTRDLRVSPQHRMLVDDWRAEVLFGEFEVLSAAKNFVNGETVYVDEGGEVEYFHILFDSHEIIFAEGAASESFHPGEEGAKAVDPDQYEELLTLFPELRDNADAFGPAARTSLKSHEGLLLRSALVD